MDRSCLTFLAASMLVTGLVARTRADQNGSDNWFKTIFSTGEYVAEETYVGEADVERGKRGVREFDESNITLRYIATPRIPAGILRLGAEWERFSFGMPDQSLLPNTLQ